MSQVCDAAGGAECVLQLSSLDSDPHLCFLALLRYSSVSGCSGKTTHPLGRPVQPKTRQHHDGLRHPVGDDPRSRHGRAQSFPPLCAIHPLPVGRPGHPECVRSSQGVPTGESRVLRLSVSAVRHGKTA